MPIIVPPLDDRDYRQILQEALARIPVHTPEWTNFNYSDPGVTLLQLFAFMIENMGYRANQIPARNRRKFLQLLGMGLRPASAAQGFVTINNNRGPLKTYQLEKDLEVRAGNVRYRTLRGLDVLPIEVRVFYKRSISDAEIDTDAINLYQRLYFDLLQRPDIDSLRYYQTTPLPPPSGNGALPVVNLSSDTNDGCLWLALLARPQDIAKNDPDPLKDVRSAIAGKILSLGIMPMLDDTGIHIAAGQTERTTKHETSLSWEILDANSSADNPQYKPLRSMTEVDLLAEPGWVDLTLPDDEKALNVFSFEPGQEGIGNAPPSLTETDIGNRVITWVRMRLQDVSAQAQISWVGANATQIIQQVKVVGEEVGQGTGEPDQCLVLANTPVMLDETLQLHVNGEQWTRVDDLHTAAPEVMVQSAMQPMYQQSESLLYRNPASAYTLDPESGQICFGDGAYGKRPPANARITANYTFGGGRQGNVGIGAVNRSPQLPSGFQISNPLRTWGGDDPEDLATAEKLIPSMVRNRERLVSAQDFYEVTLRTPGVDLGRVEILPLHAPDINDPDKLVDDKAGAVTVMVIPLDDPLHPDAPEPNRFFLDTVCRYLQPRRLVTTELYIRGPKYVDVAISVAIEVVAGRAIPPVRERVTYELYHYLSPLFGGHDRTGWPLNTAIFQRELEAVVARVDGVKLVPEDELLLGTVAADGVITSVPKIPLTGVELPRLAAVSVTTDSALPLTSLERAPTLGGDDEGTFASIPTVPDGC